MDNSSAEDAHFSFIMRTEIPAAFQMLEPGKLPPAKKSWKERNRGALQVTTGSTVVLDQHIWKEFPDDLFEAVIARLPIATFFRFHSVCRKWNSLLTSHSFSQHCAQIPQAQPWFYIITHEIVNTGAIYDPSLKKWHHTAIPAFPKKVIVLPVASAGSIVCFVGIGYRSFYVSNPLTQSFKELPAGSVKWSRIAGVGMTLKGKSTTGGYKILWVGCDGGSMKFMTEKFLDWSKNHAVDY